MPNEEADSVNQQQQKVEAAWQNVGWYSARGQQLSPTWPVHTNAVIHVWAVQRTIRGTTENPRPKAEKQSETC